MTNDMPFREALKDAYMCGFAKRSDFENRLSAMIASHPAEDHARELLETLMDCQKVFTDIVEMGGVDGHILHCVLEKVDKAIASAKGKQNG